MEDGQFTDEELKFCRLPMVYVAGPYARPDPIVNTHNTIQAADRLNATGKVVCMIPHLSLLHHLVVPHGVDDGVQVSYWYALDLAFLNRCDALLRLPGESRGADMEVTYAVKNGISVFTEESALLRHAHQLPIRGLRALSA